MNHTFKYSGTQSQVTNLLVTTCHGIGYRIGHATCQGLLAAGPQWENERDYPFRQRVNDELQKLCRDKYDLRPATLLDMTNKRMWMALPSSKTRDLCGIQVTWKAGIYTFFVTLYEDDRWIVQFTKLLFKITYDLNKITTMVEISGRELKVGEWLAALLFRLSGDEAGMLATIDEAEDRK